MLGYFELFYNRQHPYSAIGYHASQKYGGKLKVFRGIDIIDIR